MIPIEYLWLTLFIVFGYIGLARGLWKELGVTTVILLSLFALNLGERLILDKITSNLPEGVLTKFPAGTVTAIYYGATLCFVAFIAYQGITLEFPVKKQTGLFKWIFGFLGGLLNGYLIIGTVWGAVNGASYFGLKVPMGSAGTRAAISDTLTQLHNTLVQYLPVNLMNSSDWVPYVFLAVGMILLLAIILK
jgi:uncharacterized membrane protein required for colicin V production